ncbi:MAG: hypothetical protein JST21_09120 [Bacteroidetes bacterium]|nr:hypothetical protein [Bacteroidota bacterium]
MKKLALCLLIVFTVFTTVNAQCSICTKTASQLGEKQGKGFNSGIIYLMITPLAIGGVLGYRWWRSEKAKQIEEII